MMVKKGITAKSLEESRTKMANQDQDLVKCPHCGRFSLERAPLTMKANAHIAVTDTEGE